MLPTETETDRNQRGAIVCALVITAHGKETQTDRQTDRQTDIRLLEKPSLHFCITHLFLLVKN